MRLLLDLTLSGAIDRIVVARAATSAREEFGVLKRRLWKWFVGVCLFGVCYGISPAVHAAKTIPATQKKASLWSWDFGLGTSLSWSLGNLDQLTWHSSGRLAVSSPWFGIRTGISYQLGYLNGLINRNDLKFGLGASLLPRSPAALDVITQLLPYIR